MRAVVPSHGAVQKEVGFPGLQLKSWTSLLVRLSGISSYPKLALSFPPPLLFPWYSSNNTQHCQHSIPLSITLFILSTPTSIHHQYLSILLSKRDLELFLYLHYNTPAFLHWPYCSCRVGLPAFWLTPLTSTLQTAVRGSHPKCKSNQDSSVLKLPIISTIKSKFFQHGIKVPLWCSSCQSVQPHLLSFITLCLWMDSIAFYGIRRSGTFPIVPYFCACAHRNPPPTSRR